METAIICGIILVLLEIREYKNHKKHEDLLKVFSSLLEATKELKKSQDGTHGSVTDLTQLSHEMINSIDHLKKEYELKIRTSESQRFDVLEGV